MFYGPCVVLTDVTSFLVCENNYMGHVSQKYDGDDADLSFLPTIRTATILLLIYSLVHPIDPYDAI